MAHDLASIRAILAQVPDPEIPVVSIVDLGIVREVGVGHVAVTPTYSGCPATHVIEADIRKALDAAGYQDVRIETRLSPPWTTDWISETGRERLRAYGIAPPGRGAVLPDAVVRFVPRKAMQSAPIACPNCGSIKTEQLSEYGSTPCKAIHRCLACREPFDYFKPY